MRLSVRQVILPGLGLYLVAWGLRIYVRKYHIWLPDYLRWSVSRLEKPRKPVHIFFFYSDHFEPAEHVAWIELRAALRHGP